VTLPDEAEAPLVVVVDDEPAVQKAVGSLLRSVGYDVSLASSASEILESDALDRASCLVLDIRLPMVSGLEFQKRLTDLGATIPIVFMTGHADVPMTVRAMKAGAVDFLAKPFRDQEMLDAVAGAVERDREGRLQREGLAGLKTRLDTLSPREREIMALATAGLLNKQIAGKLDLSEITVKIHRGKMMRKMDARSFASLVKMAEALGVKAAPGTGR
jgi:FixJ family two-component response regulator